MPDTYTDFATVVPSGALKIDGGASAFRYQKNILINVFGDFASSYSQVLTGEWKIRVREDARKDANGKPNARVLFEQTVTWQAMVTAINIGGISFVTWQPLGDAGSGKQQTTICNGEVCATIPNIYIATQQQLADYEVSGAWKFLDRTPAQNSTPNQHFVQEEGFTIFTPEGAAEIGGYSFSAVWESANYLCDIPEGALFEVVTDKWQFGTLNRQAAYAFSYKKGELEQTLDTLFEKRTGQRWFLYVADNALKLTRSRHIAPQFALAAEKQTDFTSVVWEKPSRAMRLHRSASVLLVVLQVKGESSVRFLASYDDGQTWSAIMSLVANVTLLASAMSADGSTLWTYGISAATEVDNSKPDSEKLTQNDIIYCELKRENTTWKMAARGVIKHVDGLTLPTKDIARLERTSDILRLTFKDTAGFRVLESSDGLRSLKEVAVS